MTFEPKKINYLQSGNDRQKKAYKAIMNLGIIDKLGKFNPTLAGTIPLDIDIDTSDLDIICESSNLEEFKAILLSHFQDLDAFNVYSQEVRGIATLCSSFKFSNFDFEIFCQPIPVHLQYAVIHLNIEARLLSLAGADAKENIRKLKLQGIKTEPAFATYFKISGDPYIELAKLNDYSDQELRNLLLPPTNF